MPLFICDNCKCIENTALGRFWTKDMKSLWAKDSLGKALCSECGPTTFKNGVKVVGVLNTPGQWHNKFPKELATQERINLGDFVNRKPGEKL